MHQGPVGPCLPPEVTALRRQQENYTLKRPSCPCPNCEVGVQFSRHAKRERTFRFVFRGAVWEAYSFLMRWKCVRCGVTFTHYPPDVDPYKQYVRVDRAAFASRYTDERGMTYRQAVREGGLPVTYMDPACTEAALESTKAQEQAPRQLSPSTVWRWITDLSRMSGRLWHVEERLQRVLDRVDLSSYEVPARKHRSEARREVLVRCRKVLRILFLLGNPTASGTARSPP